jgi:cell wall-associated NlpC family hydrolase
LHVATRARARALGLAALAGAVLATLNPAPQPVAAATAADRVIAVATAQLGDPWVWAASGPGSFDCSGLVIYAYRQAGYGSAIGNGAYRSGYAMLSWARNRGLTSGTGRRGDVVVYGGGSHVGIYLGNGRVISTLTSGVRIHGLHAVTARFTTFIRTAVGSGSASGGGSSSASFRPWVTYNNVDHVRHTTSSVNVRSGPSAAYRSYGVLPAGSKLLATKSQRDGSGRIWYWAWSYAARKSVWVAGWLTR